MADKELRNLLRESSVAPENSEILSKLSVAKLRSGEEVVIFWKIRTKDGKYFNGSLADKRTTHEGKSWRNKSDALNFIQRAALCWRNNAALYDMLKSSTLIEFRTVGFASEDIYEGVENAELDRLKTEKAALEKKQVALVKEIEKLSKKS